MFTRRTFMKNASLLGIAGIVTSRKAPAFAQTLNTMRIGQVGLGSHSFLMNLVNPPKDFKGNTKIVSTGVWDDYPGVAEAMGKRGYGKPYSDLEQLIKDSDGIHIEHADYRKVFEFARPALEAGKPVFINRPFTATIADAEEAIRLAKVYNAPIMSASSLEFQPVVPQMQEFVKEKGPVRAYETYCPEPHFTWHFPHVINYANAALGGGIDTAWFTGDYAISLEERQDKIRLMGTSLCVFNYKSKDGQPLMIGMAHIGSYPGSYHINIFAAKENKMFEAGMTDTSVMRYMFYALYDFFTQRKPPRPYEAVLEQHRALVAANVSRLSGRQVKLDSLGGDDSLPYNESIRRNLVRRALKQK